VATRKPKGTSLKRKRKKTKATAVLVGGEWKWEEDTTEADRYEAEFQADLEIHPEALSEDFAQQPAKFAYWSALAERAEAKVRMLDFRLTVLEAETDAAIRKAATLRGEKTTEAGIKEEIRRNPKVQEVKNDLLTATLNAGVLKVARDAFYHRKDMLIQLGAQMRTELGEAEMRINREKVGRKVAAARRRRKGD